MTGTPLVVHIRCTRSGTWRVHDGPGCSPLTEHPTETAAERAVGDRLGDRPGTVIVHDRYDRTRGVALGRLPTGPGRHPRER